MRAGLGLRCAFRDQKTNYNAEGQKLFGHSQVSGDVARFDSGDEDNFSQGLTR